MAEEKSWSRRDVMKGTGMLTAAAVVPGLEALAAPRKSARTATSGSLKAGQILSGHELPHTDGDFYDNVFTRIGIRPPINCRGTITAISGSTSLPR